MENILIKVRIIYPDGTWLFEFDTVRAVLLKRPDAHLIARIQDDDDVDEDGEFKNGDLVAVLDTTLYGLVAAWKIQE